MNLIKLKVDINNTDSPYHYDGEAKEHNDIIEFDYLNENFIFDKKIQRVTKSSFNNTIVVDFLNKEIIIKSKEKSLSFKIKILKKKINDNKYYYLYTVDNNKIEFILEKEV